MKKRIKTLLLIVASLTFIFGFSSCGSDGYSLGDIYVSLVTVKKGANGRVESFTLDNGQTMFISAAATDFQPTNERAVINYTILGDNFHGYDYAIKLNSYMEDVLTKPIIYVSADDKAKQDELGYDRIKVAAVWAKADYINIRFAFNMGGKDQHLLNLVAVSEDKVQEGDEPIKLQFRHNKNKDEENYGSRDMHASFKLDEYIAANKDKKELKFAISWTEYNGTEKTETITFAMPNIAEPLLTEVGQ